MDDCMDLPPGFRFHPTDEEIITHYLSPKVLNPNFTTRAVGEVDLNKCEPWDLPSKAKMGEKEWYFFCQRDRKYPTGMRTNRATEAGYWKATGKDKEIFRGKALVGMKKTLVFYTGRAPKGVKSNWVMHEYRLEGKSPFTNFPKPAKDEWAVSRVFHKSNEAKKTGPMMAGLSRMNSLSDFFLDSANLPPLMDSTEPFFNNCKSNNDDVDFKGILMNPSTSYFSNMMGLDDLSNNYNQNIATSSLYNQMGQINTSLMQPAAGYLQQNSCKVDHSMISDDTGFSTDRNTEISSVISRHDIEDDLDMTMAAGSALDLENMWKC